MNEFKLQVRFGDNRSPRTYLSPDIRTKFPGWGDEQFNRPVSELIFFLPGNRFITMSGMEAYNFFIEGVCFLSTGGRQLESIYILGLWPETKKVVMWRIDKDKIKYGESTLGQEYNGSATRGWKVGVSEKPNTGLVRM